MLFYIGYYYSPPSSFIFQLLIYRTFDEKKLGGGGVVPQAIGVFCIDYPSETRIYDIGIYDTKYFQEIKGWF